MKRFEPLAVGAVAVALAVFGCSAAMAKEHTLKVYADYDGTEVIIDETKHNDVKVEYGDSLVWELKCAKCPAGTALEIEDIRHLAILDLLEDDAKDKFIKKTKKLKKVKPDYKGRVKEVYEVGDPFQGGFEAKPNKTTVKSKPYRSFDADHMWKFTWVIKVNGEVSDTWDPHFSGGRR